MKSKKIPFIIYILCILFVFIFIFLTYVQYKSIVFIFSYIFLFFILLIAILLRFHNKLLKAYEIVNQYDEDSSNQKRMLHLQEAMLELSNCMTTVNGIDELLDIILKKAIDVIPEAECGSILVMNEEGKLEFKAIFGFKQELFEVTLDPKECYQWRATSGHFNGPLIIQDLSQLSKNFMTNGTYYQMREAEALITKSSLSAPVLIDGQFFGSINVDSVKTNVFKNEHKKLMAYFANQATIAIRNHQYYEKILFMSKYDNLTGAMNRHRFQEYMEAMLKDIDQKKEPNTLVLMDLNYFKSINDQYGHTSGDIILKFFASAFSSEISHTDIFARYGGDEFIAVFFNCDTTNTAEKLQFIHSNITKKPLQLTPDGQDVYCHFSYGMAEFPTESTDLKTIIHLADRRMYSHKRMLRHNGI